jgi:hypothetical protein
VGWRALVFGCLVGCGRVGFDAAVDPSDEDVEDDLPDGDGSETGDQIPPQVCSVGGPCDDVGGTCMAGVCIIEPLLGSLQMVTCPDNMPCEVRCDGFGSCQNGVNCAGSTECTVSCTGPGACQNGVDCGGATACEVTCTGAMGACQLAGLSSHAVNCRDSDCEVTCSGLASCQAGISVGAGGSCISHCCAGACQAGHGDCVNDTMCP